MGNRKSGFMIATGIGIGGFVLGFIVAKLTGKKYIHTNYDFNKGCDYGDCDNCEFVEDCEQQ